jgi:glycosyltransferase involved in cell wall biosynthesis
MKLSVAMCTYNGSKFIKDQLNSIINQSRLVDEIIIYDDCSTDATVAIINEYIEKHPGLIQLFQNKKNLKSTKNFENAISQCNGDYIFLADQDDVWDYYKVEKIIAKFEGNESLEGIFTNGKLIDDNNETIPNTDMWESFCFFEKNLEKPVDLLCLLKHHANMVTGATLCIKKSIVDLILPFPDLTKKKFYHDEWIAIILASRNSLDYINEYLISYRIHSSQQIGVNKKKLDDIIVPHPHLIYTLQITKKYFPNSFTQCRRISRIYYNCYKKFNTLSLLYKDKKSPVDFNQIAQENLALHKKAEKKLRENSWYRYKLRKVSKFIFRKKKVL